MVILKAGTRPLWVGLGAAVWLQIASGNGATFPLYSHSLKSVLGFNHHQLTMLGVANDIGENMGLIPGLVCNNFPPWLILSVGAFACLFGYGILWLALSGTLPSLPYWLLWIALCVATNSCTWFSTAVLVTNMRNFPLSRGNVAGILKGYGGISAAVYTEIYSALLRHSASNLLLFLTLGVPTLCFALMYYVRPCTTASGDDSSEPSHFFFIQAASIVLDIYLLIATFLNSVLPLNPLVSYIFVVIMVLLLTAPLAIPLKMTLYPSSHSKSLSLHQTNRIEDQVVQCDCHDKMEPLLVPSSSVASHVSLVENDGISDVLDILI